MTYQPELDGVLICPELESLFEGGSPFQPLYAKTLWVVRNIYIMNQALFIFWIEEQPVDDSQRVPSDASAHRGGWRVSG